MVEALANDGSGNDRSMLMVQFRLITRERALWILVSEVEQSEFIFETQGHCSGSSSNIPNLAVWIDQCVALIKLFHDFPGVSMGNSGYTSDLRCSDLVIVSLQLCILRRNFALASEVVDLPGLIDSFVGVDGYARMVRIGGDFGRHGQGSSWIAKNKISTEL